MVTDVSEEHLACIFRAKQLSATPPTTSGPYDLLLSSKLVSVTAAVGVVLGSLACVQFILSLHLFLARDLYVYN